MHDEVSHALVLVAPPDTIGRVHELLERMWADAPHISAIDRMSFETALIEVAANVIQHANHGNPVECTVAVDATGGSISATLIDTGEQAGLELSTVEMPEGAVESGRGLAIVKALVDEISYDSDGTVNCWRLTRRLGSERRT